MLLNCSNKCQPQASVIETWINTCLVLELTELGKKFKQLYTITTEPYI